MSKSIFSVITIILIMFYMSLFIIYEGQRGILLRFGKVVRNEGNKPLVYTPGLHLKIPFIEKVKTIDARIQTMDNQADRFVTKEKKDLIVDSYIKWRVSDFSHYYLATGGGDSSRAEVIIKRKFSDRLRSEIGRLDVKDIVTDSRGRLTTDVRDSLNTGNTGNAGNAGNEQENDSMPLFIPDRNSKSNHNESMFNSNSMTSLGIEIVDVRIKQINLPIEVSDAIYNRMRAEREAVARRQRSQGQEEAEKLRAQADYKVNHTIAEAKRKALILRGEGEAEVANLFANAFNQAPDFYFFMRSLRAYENSFTGKKDIFVLSPNKDFLKYMKDPVIL